LGHYRAQNSFLSRCKIDKIETPKDEARMSLENKGKGAEVIGCRIY